MEVKKVPGKHGVVQNMGCGRNCCDNAVSESFLYRLKTQLVHHIRVEFF
jgi:hypothetical protein